MATIESLKEEAKCLMNQMIENRLKQRAIYEVEFLKKHNLSIGSPITVLYNGIGKRPQQKKEYKGRLVGFCYMSPSSTHLVGIILAPWKDNGEASKKHIKLLNYSIEKIKYGG